MPRMNGADAARAPKVMPEVPIRLFTMCSENIGPYLETFGVEAVLSKADGLTALVKAVDAVRSAALRHRKTKSRREHGDISNKAPLCGGPESPIGPCVATHKVGTWAIRTWALNRAPKTPFAWVHAGN